MIETYKKLYAILDRRERRLALAVFGLMVIVVFLEKGRITATGTYEELLSSSVGFSRLTGTSKP